MAHFLGYPYFSGAEPFTSESPMGWLRRSKVYGFYARTIRRRVFGSAVAIPDELRGEWKEVGGHEIDLSVDWRDEMYLHFHRPFQGRRALESYLQTGHQTLDLVKDIVTTQGLDPKALGKVLEFASGYGRNTRFLRTLFDPSKLYVCDIDKNAVDANAQRFGTQPLYSASEPNDWVCDERFDLIFVASLFTHLSYESWGGWLGRLRDVLEPGGVLIITTHGLDWLREENRVVHIEGGFCYLRANETSGRLSCDEYGSCYVSPEWVRTRLHEYGLEEALAFKPNALWGQDVWVLRRKTS